jgi:hypothetical protein
MSLRHAARKAAEAWGVNADNVRAYARRALHEPQVELSGRPSGQWLDVITTVTRSVPLVYEITDVEFVGPRPR